MGRIELVPGRRADQALAEPRVANGPAAEQKVEVMRGVVHGSRLSLPNGTGLSGFRERFAARHIRTEMPDVAEILGEAEWLTRLARSLTGSAADADDVVQDTFVAALRSPPDPDRPVRPWLRRVATNIVRMRHRGRVRRDARDQVIDQIIEPTPTPEQLLARARVERTLTDLVLALEEPYRTTILLRYREGLTAERSRGATACRRAPCGGG